MLFCHIYQRYVLLLIILIISIKIGSAQTFLKTSDIFQISDNDSNGGNLNIIREPVLDSLINRYIIRNKKKEEYIGYPGIEGFRIQIYSNMDISAKVESSKIEIDFNSQFPNIVSYRIFAEPRWYKVRVGNFRSRAEAIKLYLIIIKQFPNSDIVPDIINLNDLDEKNQAIQF